MTIPFAATAYGAQLAFVLDAALAWWPALFACEEHALARALAVLPAAASDLAARLVARRRVPVAEAQLGVARAAVDAAIAAGWIARVVREQAQSTFLADDADAGLAPTPAALALTRAALVVAFADDVDDASPLVRLALGSLAAPAGTPLAARLAGGDAAGARRAAFADRAGLDAFLAARAARAEGPTPAAFTLALARVEAAAGEPLPLVGYQLTATHQWTALLHDAVERLKPDDPRFDRALRALRRAPLAPPIARRVWSAVHAREARPLRARRLAAEFATWRLWPAGDRARWRLRADGARARATRATWPTLRVAAWLARDGANVRAQGERVEDFALARFARDGWRGVHGEGAFWLALAAALFRRECLDAAGVAWSGPLQAAPLDWGRAGFATRRAHAIARRAAAVVRDPLAALAEARDGDAWLPGPVAPPPYDAACAVCARFPRGALAELCARVLTEPREAAGLPDLVLWRDDRLALHEVKSPNDALSDAQRAWLAWLVERGIDAGVVRVDARAPRQDVAAFAAASPGGAAVPAAGAREQRGGTLARERDALREHGRPGRPLPQESDHRVAALRIDLAGPRDVAAGAPTGAARAPRFASSPLMSATRWRGRLGDDAVDGWARPVDALVALDVAAVLGERRRGRVALARRWFTLPPGWAVPALVAHEARADGGLAPVATLLVRPAGWLVPREFAAYEPVCAPRAEILAAAAGAAVDWARHPDLEPWRPERAASAWGVERELADQLALIGATPHRLRLDAHALHLDLPADASCLWTARDPRLVRGVLAHARQDPGDGASVPAV